MNDHRKMPMTQAEKMKVGPMPARIPGHSRIPGHVVASSMTPENERKSAEQTDSQTDLQLVRKVRSGDRAAFDLLVVKYQSRVASIISRYVYDNQEVMDLTQETFVKAVSYTHLTLPTIYSV